MAPFITVIYWLIVPFKARGKLGKNEKKKKKKEIFTLYFNTNIKDQLTSGDIAISDLIVVLLYAFLSAFSDSVGKICAMET